MAGAALLLAGCGGASAPTVISFGDSLSDVGTYAVALPVAGAGRFTVNGAGPRVWTEFVAAELGQSLSANQSGGVTLPAPIAQTFPAVQGAGRSYAQGGARVDASGISQISSVSLSSISIRQQVDRFLGKPPTSEQNLVLMNGGGNDIGYWGQQVLGGLATPEAALVGVVAAAGQMAEQALRLRDVGQVVVLNQADGALAPVANNPVVRALYQVYTPAFNAALANALQGSGVVVVDQFALSHDIAAQPSVFGFVNTRDVACRLEILPLPSAVLCTDQSLVAPDAATSYQWADTLHGTPGYHRALAHRVMAVLRAKGVL